MKTNSVKGFNDYLGEEAMKRESVRKIVEEACKVYGFEPAETPVIEYRDFVQGENKEDEAVSDIYKLEDKGGRKLALRYEFTFQLKRIAQGQKLPFKRYQIGPVFRDEPVSGNRSRQFTTCEIDTIGPTLADDAELLAVANNILKNLKIPSTIYINNRKLLNEILDKEGIKKSEQSKVIREIDKLDKLPIKEVKKNLEKYKAEKIVEIFKKPEKYFERYDSYGEIKKVKSYCKSFDVEVVFLPSLARGLSYYTGTIFEIKTNKMKETVLGGGRYVVGDIEGVGFGTSIERLSLLANIDFSGKEFLVVSLGQDKEAIKLAQKLRSKGQSVSIYYGKPSKALSYANNYKFKKAIFVGEKEVKGKKFKVKDLASGIENLIRF